MSIFLVVFMYATWSSVFSLGKWALEYSPPLFLTASRMILAGVILLAYLAFRNRASLKINLKQLLSLVLLAIFNIYLANALEFWGLQQMTAAKTCFFYSLAPFFSALFSYIHFGEKMNRRKWVGMLIGFVGFLFPIVFSQKGSDELLSSLAFISWPELAMIGATICSVYGWILLRLLVKDQSTSSLMANGSSMFLGGLMALGHSFLVDSWSPIPIASGGAAVFIQSTLIMTLISNIFCYNLYGYLLTRFTATFLSFMGLLSPIFASLNAWFFLGEQPSPMIFLSTGIISMGLWLIYSAELRQGYIKKTDQPAAVSA
jgi:drug/metabolite transporter (DMT)-like permease